MLRRMSACASALSQVKRLFLLGLASGSLLVGLFVSPLPTQASTVSDVAAQPSPSVQTLSLTNADNGRTIKVPHGTLIKVNLSMPNYVWSVPRSSNTTVLSTLPGGITSSSGSITTASFFAASRGTATVSAIASPSCALSQPACMIAAYGWTVTITVSR